MRIAFALILLISSVSAFAADEDIYLDSSSSNIPTAYSSAAGSKIKTFVKAVAEICIYNGSSSEIAVNFQNGTSAATPAVDNFILAASTGLCRDKNIGAALYIRSRTGVAISSGKISGGVIYK